jgi:hypothetical protein
LLADYDYSRYSQVIKWPIAEALEAYHHKLIDQAREDYRHRVMCWSTFAAQPRKKKLEPPKEPAILKE